VPRAAATEPVQPAWHVGRVLRVGVGLVAIGIALWMFVFPAFFHVTTDGVVNVRVTRVRAPVDGYVGPLTLEEGDRVRRGEPLTSVASLTGATLTSHIDGVVLRRPVVTGEFVVAGTELLVLADPSTAVVEASFPQRSLAGAQPGDHALVHLLGTSGQWPGTVKAVQVEPTGSPDPSYAYALPPADPMSFRVVVELDARPGPLPYAGQRAKVLLIAKDAGLFERGLVWLYALGDL